MSREMAQKSKSTTALFTFQGVGMIAETVTSESTHPQKLLVARRALHGVMDLFVMPLKTDEFVVLAAADLPLVAFPPAFSWGSVLTVAARKRKN